MEILHQIVPVPASVKQLDFRGTNSSNEIVFLAVELPPLGYKSFFITKLPENTIEPEEPKPKETKNGPIQIGNKYMNLTFNDDGLLETITADGVTSKLTQ